MIHTRFFIIILIILGGIASCQDQPDNLSIKENHANIKSRSLAISKDEAIDLVKQKFCAKIHPILMYLYQIQLLKKMILFKDI